MDNINISIIFLFVIVIVILAWFCLKKEPIKHFSLSPHTRYLVTVPRSGLCNRLRNIRSCYTLAQRSGRELICVWIKDDDLGAKWSDLFHPPKNFTIKESKSISIPFKSSYFESTSSTPLPKKAFKKALLGHKNIVTIRDNNSLQSTENNSMFYKNNIRPLDSINYKIANFLNSNHIDLVNSVGFHIRRTDYTEKTGKYTTKKFVNFAKKLHPRFSIFVCSDDSSEIKKIRKLCQRNIYACVASKDRDNKGGMEAAVVDLWLLSTCSLIVGCDTSFSREAGIMSGKEVYQP